MYRNMEVIVEEQKNRGTLMGMEKSTKRDPVETLLNLTEAIATLTIGAGFLLLVAACLSAL
ncbi:MAG: hypothetical protein IKM59_05535 [Oscillospiraceae bacterium]|nr:hypothetical protein [Oscillospiraceae bacterium]